ncbi:MAG: hypothetical protein ABW141_14505 [Candidatus Thiodiazotropha endolucinida]
MAVLFILSESIGMNGQIEWNTQLRIPDRIAHGAEINCRSIPEFAAGGAGTFAYNSIIHYRLSRYLGYFK